ncbi:Double-stranded DNA-binding domain protein [Ancylostoma caninum]|uniref:Double-stranded DNA-binding domain protein n=1 Tax=Ancylostoma caninum TaxID=29170 RepID=A0A368F035_ANCCA|nr:Double-stranded DNA-binding domain protein [Ancylostoma caninum]
MSSTPQLPPGLEAQAGPQNANQQDNARQQGENQENAVNSMLSQILDQQALVRLSNLSAAKPEKAKMVESAVINMARRGQIVGKLSDEALKQLMERVAMQTTRTTTVKFDRRRNNLDSDDDDF